jgi:catechol 2,3-dioxygenase-like lactoylglutathione lyase family enzyme
MDTHSPMIIHYVYDMDRAYAFYSETLGLAPDTRSAGWSTLKCGDLLVALHTAV